MLRPCKLSKNASDNKGIIISTANEKDRISQLPDEIVYSIISYLTLRDAVKTSVLSHRWKYACSSSLSKLHFDWDSMNPQLLETCQRPCTLDTARNFVQGVHEFLQFYKGTHISSFKINCCLGHEWADDIDQWVRFATGKGVEQLSLRLYCDKYCSYHNDVDKNGGQIEGKYVLWTLYFQSIQSNLKHLTLTACTFGPDIAYQFSCLESLRLSFMPLSVYDLNSMFSSLLKLKVLKLSRCTLPVKLCLTPLLLLNEFEVFNSVGLEQVELSNRNLLTFICICSQMVSFDLRGAPNLIKFACHAVRWKWSYFLDCLPKQLDMLRSLQIITTTKWVGWIPKTISTFSQVTTLALKFLELSKFNILKIILVLEAFPNLRSLKLSTHCPEDIDEDILNPGGEYVPKHLAEVRLSGFYGTPKQIEFAIYLLKNASSLERMVITPNIRTCQWIPSREWDEGERQRIQEGLQEFAKEGVLTVR